MNKNQDQNSHAIPSGHPSQTEQALPDTHTPQRSALPQPREDLRENQVFGPIIYRYSRAHALAERAPRAASQLAAEAGFKFPVFITAAVYEKYIQVPEGVTGQDETGRLCDILTMLHHAIRHAPAGATRLPFQLYVRNSDSEPAQLVTLAAEIGAKDFDDPAPALTIMLADED